MPEPGYLGDYELIRLVAEGGMADIYLARRTTRLVALKVLSAERATDPDTRALFIDEARVLALLDHPNVARVHEVDRDDDVYFLAMEYVHGCDLREVLTTAAQLGRAIPFPAAVAIVAGAAAGLDHAHHRCDPYGQPMRLVHRDVSLSNIMVGHAGEVKVVDFGIASASVSSHLTNPGVVRGKPSYMAPEQCLGEGLDRRSDVFSLGVVLYELSTGKRCFTGASDLERMVAIIRSQYVPPHAIDPGFPSSLELVIATALAADPARRYPSCAAMCEALETVVYFEGWTHGVAPITELMRDLYGDVTTPEVTIVPPSQPSPEPPDDEPTRGRRSVREIYPGWAA